jgi:GT2 family glycosyltransferase
MTDHPTFSIEVLRDIETSLSDPTFRGVPLGPTLNDVGVIEFYLGHGDWSAAARWKNRLRRVKYSLRPVSGRMPLPTIPRNRILITWLRDNFRFSGLVHPMLKEFEPERPVVLCGENETLDRVPDGFQTLSWRQAMQFDIAAWRADYRKCRNSWHERLRDLCDRRRLPRGAYDLLAFHLLLASQYTAGCLEMLPILQPTAILVEYDRNAMWSCLVSAARRLGIPTYTMVHGVLNEHALGYVPVLADKIFCWGEIQHRQLIAESESPGKVVIAGCPRFTRELTTTPAEARAELGLPVDRPVVLFGSTMVSKQERLDMAELFCVAAEKVGDVSAVIRLHPSERLDIYESVAKHHPTVRFSNNSDATLDEILAAADIVVVPNSGLGSDALIKRRLTIVLDVPNQRLGHGADLIEQAKCPRATNAAELADAVRQLLFDENERRNHFTLAEHYVAQFCSAFGSDSARRIGEQIRADTSVRKKPTAETDKSAFRGGSSEPIPDVSVVIVSWNVSKLLADCLDSLQKTSEGLSLEVWVVDNASSDDSVKMLQTRYPWVHLIANNDNRGFARANNQAFEQARGRYVLILNPDTIVQDGAIQTLIQCIESHPDVAMAGPCLRDFNGEIDATAARRAYSLSISFWIDSLRAHKLPFIGSRVRKCLLTPYDFAVTQEVESISGAAMLLRGDLPRELRGFGDTFIHCGEDIDLCFRIRAAGWKIYYDAAATIVHLGRQSSKQAPVCTNISVFLSNQEFFSRCRGRGHALLYRLISQVICMPQLLLVGCVKYVLGRESRSELKYRLALTWHLINWRLPRQSKRKNAVSIETSRHVERR